MATLSRFLQQYPCSTSDECREFLRALRVSPWEYHLDDNPRALSGPLAEEFASNADDLAARLHRCELLLGGRDGMWAAYGKDPSEGLMPLSQILAEQFLEFGTDHVKAALEEALCEAAYHLGTGTLLKITANAIASHVDGFRNLDDEKPDPRHEEAAVAIEKQAERLYKIAKTLTKCETL